MPTVVHVCSDVYSSEVPAGTNLTHTPPLIRISSLSTCNRKDINPKSIGQQPQMIQNRSKNNKKLFWERTNISPKSIGQQPKSIQNLVRKSFKKQFLELVSSR